jgi:hypothetical protein
MLLSLTLLFSAFTAGLAMMLNMPPLGMIVTMVGYFGLLFATTKFSNSALGLVFIFALTGFSGEKGVLSLVERFYFYMDTLPEAKGLRAIHAPDLSSAKDKLFKFLSGWLGGPDLFIPGV